MNGTARILAINGSYRDRGITDQAVDHISEELQALGADVEHIRLRDYPIEFCLNCRQEFHARWLRAKNSTLHVLAAAGKEMLMSAT